MRPELLTDLAVALKPFRAAAAIYHRSSCTHRVIDNGRANVDAAQLRTLAELSVELEAALAAVPALAHHLQGLPIVGAVGRRADPH